jgi:hypothetical protein
MAVKRPEYDPSESFWASAGPRTVTNDLMTFRKQNHQKRDQWPCRLMSIGIYQRNLSARLFDYPRYGVSQRGPKQTAIYDLSQSGEFPAARLADALGMQLNLSKTVPTISWGPQDSDIQPIIACWHFRALHLNSPAKILNFTSYAPTSRSPSKTICLVMQEMQMRDSPFYFRHRSQTLQPTVCAVPV